MSEHPFGTIGGAGVALTTRPLIRTCVGGPDMADPTCSVEGCERPRQTRGWCSAHYKRWLARGTTDPYVRPHLECTFPGCDRPHLARGFCSGHLRQQKKGYEMRPLREPTERSIDTLCRLIADPGPECIIWPGRSRGLGYSVVCVDKREWYGHRLVCTWTHGDPPTPLHEAAHSCGVSLCVNPNHIRWATRLENEADKITHGTLRFGEALTQAKLTTAQAAEIRSTYQAGGVSQRELADRFGISETTVRSIVIGKTWRRAIATIAVTDPRRSE